MSGPTNLTLGIALLTLLLATTFASAQEKEIRLSFEGPEVFCHVLHQLKLEPIKSFDLTDAPAQSMVVLFGNPNILTQPVWPIELEEFARRGGNVLIATDHLFEGFGVRIPGSKIVHPDGSTYGGEPRCPLLSHQGHEPAHEHPIFLGLHKSIATNCPSHLRIRAENLVDLLNFAPQAKRDGTPVGAFPRPGFIPMTRPFQRLAYIAGSPKDADAKGRIIVIAGNGVFMNGMMLQTDNANFDFAVNLVRWLREGPNDQTRTRALFVVDGDIIEDFDMNLAPPAPPLPTPTVTMLNRLIRGLENERFFHHLLGDLVRGDWNRLLTVLLGVVTLVLVAYGGKKVLQGRHAPETAAPSVVGAPLNIDVAGAVGAAREQAIMRKTDFAAPARLIIQQWFRRAFGIDVQRSMEFRATGKMWTRWHLGRQASLVLRLALQTTPLSRHEFFLLIEALQDLERSLQAGEVTLYIDGKVVRQIS